MDVTHTLLTPLALLYGAAIRVRNLYYDRVPTATRRAGLGVISVGNLTAGGTGKTPMVIEIVKRLRALGRQPAILTRGYKGAADRPADEVLEFHEAVPDVPVVVSADRVAGAAAARREHHADCVVLDDGFQHRRLARDLDIVLVDALAPWGGGRLLPAGRLREPLSALRRADILVITRSNQVEPAVVESISAELKRRAGEQPVIKADVEACGLQERAGQHVLAVCGIGNPQTFEWLIAARGAAPQMLVFPDHHRYTGDDVSAICTAADRFKAEQVVTTRKDWVKLGPLWPAAAPPLVRLDMRLRLQGDGGELDERLRQAVETRA